MHFSNIYPSKTLCNQTPDNSLPHCLCTSVSLYNKLNQTCQKIIQLWFYTDDWHWNHKNFSPNNLLQSRLVQLCHISGQSQICNTQYMVITCCAYSCTQYGLMTWCAYSCTQYSLHTQYMLMSCCAYSWPQYGLHTQYMLLTHVDHLLCLQLHTVRSPHTVHASNPCWSLAVPTAGHSTISIHSTCF